MIGQVALALSAVALAVSSHAVSTTFERHTRAWWVCKLGVFVGGLLLAVTVAKALTLVVPATFAPE